MEKQLSRISIVIPVFNGQDTIAACLDSVLRQSYDQFEAIIINDGSIDQTAQILRVYADRDARIKVTTISNHGVNYARQLGVQQAAGDYVTFLDADDQLRDNALEMYVNHIEDHDVLMANCFINKVIGKEEYLSLMMDERLPKELWGKLFRRRLFTVEVMSLPKDIGMGEDYIWNIRMTGAIQSVRLIKDNYYGYDDSNLNSAMHRFKRSIPYEKSFLQILQDSLLGLGKTDAEAYDLLVVQRFNMFIGFAKSNDVDFNDSFIRELARPTKVLRTKRNIVLYAIMWVPSVRLKAWLIQAYFKVKPLI